MQPLPCNNVQPKENDIDAMEWLAQQVGRILDDIRAEDSESCVMPFLLGELHEKSKSLLSIAAYVAFFQDEDEDEDEAPTPKKGRVIPAAASKPEGFKKLKTKAPVKLKTKAPVSRLAETKPKRNLKVSKKQTRKGKRTNKS